MLTTGNEAKFDYLAGITERFLNSVALRMCFGKCGYAYHESAFLSGF